MRGKLLFITGGLAGYVLGARAGRKRYDQIAAAANDLWNAKPVQRRVTEVRDATLELVGEVPAILFKAGKNVVKQAAAKKKSKQQGGGATPVKAPETHAASEAKASTTASRTAAVKPKPKPKATPGAKPGAHDVPAQ